MIGNVRDYLGPDIVPDAAFTPETRFTYRHNPKNHPLGGPSEAPPDAGEHRRALLQHDLGRLAVGYLVRHLPACLDPYRGQRRQTRRGARTGHGSNGRGLFYYLVRPGPAGHDTQLVSMANPMLMRIEALVDHSTRPAGTLVVHDSRVGFLLDVTGGGSDGNALLRLLSASREHPALFQVQVTQDGYVAVGVPRLSSEDPLPPADLRLGLAPGFYWSYELEDADLSDDERARVHRAVRTVVQRRAGGDDCRCGPVWALFP